MNIILSIIIFGIVIAIHEFGHFSMAKINKVKVNEFSIGMGPNLLSKVKGDTLYSLRAIPIGGYVAMEGEDEYSENKNAFNKKNPFQKIAIIFAGPFMNFVLTFIILMILFLISGIPVNKVGSIVENSPAYNSILKINDKIISINNVHINNWDDVNKAVNTNGKNNIENIIVERDAKLINITLKSESVDGIDIIGIYPLYEKKNIIETSAYTIVRIYDMTKQMINFVTQLITGKADFNSVSGPIGIIKTVGSSVNTGWQNTISLVAIISLNLGIINLLPFPALDGGRILFSLVELISGKKIDSKIESYVNFSGMVFLIAMMLFVSYKDVIKLL